PAEWDDSLPLPAPCLDNATFTPAGDGGSAGGTIECSVPSSYADTVAFTRALNRERRLATSESESEGAITFTYGDVATLQLQDRGSDGTFLVATQQFTA
ncbi:MAG: hypothetical protein H0W25_12555, partial [Acidimicrobiia bacterium]|nr:hypothetical protein [Acidimicrobiia bacterium]